MRAAGDGLDADPELPQQAAHVHLAAVDPDRAGDRGGPRDDAVRAHRDVVAARGRVVREARDHRLLGATALHLTPDVVACPGVPARAVDAQHDRADRVALARLVQRLDQGLGAQEPFSVRADVTLAGYDRAARDDQSNVSAVRPRDAVRVAPERHGREARSPAPRRQRVEVGLVERRVDQPARPRLARLERSLVELPLDEGRRPAARGRQAVHQQAVVVVEQRLERLARGRRHVPARVGLDRRLVAAHVHEIGRDTDLVEGAAQEQHRGAQAVELERGRGRHAHDASGRSQKILGLAPAAQARVDRLSGGGEATERIAHLGELGPAPADTVDVQHDRAHVVVLGRALDRAHHRVERDAAAASRPEHQRAIRRLGFLQRRRHVQHERGHR